MQKRKNVIPIAYFRYGYGCLILIVTLFCRHALADGAQSGGDDVSQDKINAANTRLLQKTVEEQRSEIALLQKQIAALKSQIESMGLVPVTDPTTRPTVSKPRRIIFIDAQFSSIVTAEIHKAVDQLDSDQWFNIYTLNVDAAYPYQPHFVQATDANKRKLDANSGTPVSFGYLLSGLAIAAKVHPDLIWIVGEPYGVQSEDPFMHDLHQILKGSQIRIDTALDFMPHKPQDLHLYWRISHETNGVCVDKNGNPMDEPPVPLSPPPITPQPQPRSPTILKDSP